MTGEPYIPIQKVTYFVRPFQITVRFRPQLQIIPLERHRLIERRRRVLHGIPPESNTVKT
jgi:hypothetical protein